jgi:DNA-binding transcriptional ArsR family regulator
MTYGTAAKQDALDNVIRALADPRRRAILEQLSKKETAVKDLTARLKISQPAVSQHLATLRGAGLVTERHEGRRVYYKVCPDGLRPVVNWLTHYRAFWPERVERLQKLLEEMDE